MELNIGDQITITKGNYIDKIVTIFHITPKRAYADQNKWNITEWNYTLKREYTDPNKLYLMGQGEWSTYRANITTEEDKENLLKAETIRLATKFFENLMKDKKAMMKAYERLLEQET